jgi:hypothetical protein
MNALVLTGLRGSQPLGFLASLGVFLALSQGNATLRFAWVRRNDWMPIILPGNQVFEIDEICDALHALAKQRAAALEFTWRDTIKADVSLYRQFAIDARDLAMSGDQLAAEFAAAFANDQVLMKSKPEVKPTPLDNTAGQQKFLGVVRGLGVQLSGMDLHNAQKAFREALLGPWLFGDEVHSLGWDPSAERLHAYGAQKPSEIKARGVLPAVWLAAMGVAMFPVAVERGRFSVAGFDSRNSHFSWPVWETPISIQTIRSLLTRAEWAGHADHGAVLRAIGITTVFRSKRVVSDHGYGQQRAAVSVV